MDCPISLNRCNMRRKNKIPLFMISVIHDNIDELNRDGKLARNVIRAKSYYDLNNYQWQLAKRFANGSLFNLFLYLYETAYNWDNTVLEFTTHLYNKTYKNKQKNPFADRNIKKSTVIDIDEEEVDAAF